MSLIDKTYFHEPFTWLPQSEALGNGVSQKIKDSDSDLITNNIDYFEDKFLISILGQDLYDAFIEGITPVEGEHEEEEIEDKWLLLKSKLIDEDKKNSPIANYIYCYIMPQLVLKTTRDGIVVSKGSETSSFVSGINKQVAAWNEMVDMLDIFYQWLRENNNYDATILYNPYKYANSFGI